MPRHLFLSEVVIALVGWIHKQCTRECGKDVLSITLTTHVVVHTAHECLRRLHICAITLGSGNYNSAHQCLKTLGVCICGQ